MSSDIFILDFMYSVNDVDFYMDAITFGGDKKKVKLDKEEFLKWCRSLENDEQAWELSTYQYFYDIL